MRSVIRLAFLNLLAYLAFAQIWGNVAVAQQTCDQETLATLSWAAPTQRTDGSTLTNLAGFKLYWGTTSGGPYPNMTTIDNPGVLSYAMTACNLDHGVQYYFVATAFDALGVESDYSNEATKLTASPPPMPPTLTVQAAQTAYAIQTTDGRIVLLPIGSVAAGTVCDTSQAVRDGNGITAYIVPRTSVTPLPTSRAVWAKCN